MNTAIMIIVVLVGIGAFFGVVLALADKKFAMEVNPLIQEVEEVLPKGQCGACGFAGCAKYAEAVVEQEDVPPDLCVPGKAAVAAKVAELTGKKAGASVPRYAHLKCRGTRTAAVMAARYEGVPDCAAAKLVQGGPKGCKYGCIGFGNCVRACPFGALSMGEDGLPVVDKSICTGCGKCVSTCPQALLVLQTFDAPVQVECSSHDKGPAARKLCKNACIGCGLCMRSCTHGAIRLDRFVAVVDTEKCRDCEEPVCLEKCPTKAISQMISVRAAEKTA
ncbi:RnfABCDGE type electron transport complex subunit B [Selenomonas montiformis]|uniref:RnfABCDGE type electron transport complex subunit B n=1 Tax=Selenomonas montiformis TaxID=2652285 RepID=UPI003F8940E6